MPKYCLHKLTNLSTKVCFNLQLGRCGGVEIKNVDKLEMQLYRAGEEAEDQCIVTYTFFTYDPFDKRMCMILDDAIKDLCEGRYIGRLFYGCKIIDEIWFILSTDVVATNVEVIDDKAADCQILDISGATPNKEQEFNNPCCVKCGEPIDECSPCGEEKCECCRPAIEKVRY